MREKYYYKFGDSCHRRFIRTSKPIFEIINDEYNQNKVVVDLCLSCEVETLNPNGTIIKEKRFVMYKSYNNIESTTYEDYLEYVKDYKNETHIVQLNCKYVETSYFKADGYNDETHTVICSPNYHRGNIVSDYNDSGAFIKHTV